MRHARENQIFLVKRERTKKQAMSLRSVACGARIYDLRRTCKRANFEIPSNRGGGEKYDRRFLLGFLWPRTTIEERFGEARSGLRCIDNGGRR